MYNAVLCSIKEDLNSLDKAGLVMNGIKVTDNLTSSFEPLIEGEANILIITDKIIEEQSNLIEVSKSIKVLYELYKGKIRVIYFKTGIDSDFLTNLMDSYNNWDIHYNTSLKALNTEDVLKYIEERTMPNETNSSLNKNKTLEEVRNRAETIVKELVKSLENSTVDITSNDEFISIIMRNMAMVKDLVISHHEYKNEFKELEKYCESLIRQLDRLSDSNNEKSKTINRLTLQFDELDSINNQLNSELKYTQGKLNKILESVRGIINPQEIYTSLTDVLDTTTVKTNMPNIIYIKEIDQINYLTTYLNNLTNLFNSTVGLTKLLVIENDLKTLKVPMYEKKNIVYVTDGTDLSRVVLGNLVTCGNSPKLINYLLQNSFNLDYLIILDRTGNYLPLIEGPNVATFYSCKEESDLNDLGIYSRNVITNNKESLFNLPKIKDYSSIEGNYELEISVITSLDITKKLTSFIKEWESVKKESSLEGELV